MRSNPFLLDGETALVTGGGTGLGFAIASSFVEAGARVILTGRRADVLESAATRLGERASFEVHDVTDRTMAPVLVDRVWDRYGALSILVNNAGVHLKKPFDETTDDEFDRVLDTHIAGSFALSRAAGHRMKEQGRGSLLFMASMTSFIGMPRVVAYSAAKSACLGVVRALAAELSPHGVRVNAIAPGWIESPMLRQALSGDEERQRKILSRTPMGRFGCPEDIGWAAVYFSSRAARFVTGVVLPVDGGASVGF